MKLLICTQALDSQDSNLGFFHRWVEEFAAHCEQVSVICLREGEHALPPNVRVYSLGKEKGAWRITRALRFVRYVRTLRGDYDAVFVHMNPEYIVLAGRYWRAQHKRVSLWYAHKSVTRRLKRAVFLADIIFTVSPQSFGISTPKVCAVGHGIDTELFVPDMHLESTELRIITTGRLAARKHLLEMLQALDELHARSEKFSFTIVGEAGTPEEERYQAKLLEEIARRPYREKVSLVGGVPHGELPRMLREHDLFFNFSETGNMDKAGLEALACGLPLLTTNKAFEPLLAGTGLFVPSMTPRDVVAALEAFFGRPDRPGIAAMLRNKVVAEHSLQALIPKLLEKLA